MTLTVKQISSLEKIREYSELPLRGFSSHTVLGGESFSYQLVVSSMERARISVSVKSSISEYVKLYFVNDAVMDYPHGPEDDGGDFITDKPGPMPDILVPAEKQNNQFILYGNLRSIWVEVCVPEGFKPGRYEVEVNIKSVPVFNSTEEVNIAERMYIDVIGVDLPKQKLAVTQWFHTDCIATVHNVPVYSEEHWALIDSYIKTAVKLGINMILTPVITPPLDTGYGNYRPCVQLVKIEKVGEKYNFDFTLLKRFVDICKKNGVEYYEISHLFSQWGLAYAPNIMVTEDGRDYYKFGWDVSSRSPEYKDFLEQLLPALVKELKAYGVFDRCNFHLSDEPQTQHLENYKYAHSLVKPLIEGRPIMDALSNYEFYEMGLVDLPVTGTGHIEHFLEKKLENQWAYYCGGGKFIANRCLAMPAYRNRIIGLQLYKYDIKGFLQWGYNFYYSMHSHYPINPYFTTSTDMTYPSGDPFSVYPGEDGPYMSMRAVIFKEALQDIEVCRTLEKHIGKEKVVELIENQAGMEITFSQYPRNKEYIPNLMARIKGMIKEYEG